MVMADTMEAPRATELQVHATAASPSPVETEQVASSWQVSAFVTTLPPTVACAHLCPSTHPVLSVVETHV
jgi:hypothetical protein